LRCNHKVHVMKEEMEDGSISQLILEKEAMANERLSLEYLGAVFSF